MATHSRALLSSCIAIIRAVSRTTCETWQSGLIRRGTAQLPAQFAAALEPAIGSLYLAEGLISFRSIVETELYNYPFGNFVPNLLAHTDLPELTVSLAPRRVTLAGTVDGAGNQMASEAVRAAFPSASNIRVLPEPAWSPSDILSA